MAELAAQVCTRAVAHSEAGGAHEWWLHSTKLGAFAGGKVRITGSVMVLSTFIN